jgi:hypothetical protein
MIVDQAGHWVDSPSTPRSESSEYDVFLCIPVVSDGNNLIDPLCVEDIYDILGVAATDINRGVGRFVCVAVAREVWNEQTISQGLKEWYLFPPAEGAGGESVREEKNGLAGCRRRPIV